MEIKDLKLNERIKLLRKERNLTQKELAKLAGLSEITIRKYERAERNPKLEQIEKIAKALGVTNTNLMGDREVASGDMLNTLKSFDIEKITKKYSFGTKNSTFRMFNEYCNRLIPSDKKSELMFVDNLFLILSTINECLDLEKNILNIQQLHDISDNHNITDEILKARSITLNNINELIDKFIQLSLTPTNNIDPLFSKELNQKYNKDHNLWNSYQKSDNIEGD